MATQEFYLAGDFDHDRLRLDISGANDLEALKLQIAGEFHVVQPVGEKSRQILWQALMKYRWDRNWLSDRWS